MPMDMYSPLALVFNSYLRPFSALTNRTMPLAIGFPSASLQVPVTRANCAKRDCELNAITAHTKTTDVKRVCIFISKFNSKIAVSHPAEISKLSLGKRMESHPPPQLPETPADAASSCHILRRPALLRYSMTTLNAMEH